MKSKGQELLDLWNDNEETMGEMAAYHVACEQLGIDPDDGGKTEVKIGNVRQLRKIIFRLIKTNPSVSKLLFRYLGNNKV